MNSFLIFLLSIIGFVFKAFITGLGLAGGFFVTGMITRYIDFYFIPFMKGQWDKPVPFEGCEGRTYREEWNQEWFIKPFDPIFKLIETYKVSLSK